MQGPLIPLMTLGMQAGSQIMAGKAAKADARAQKQVAEINAYIGRTRAIQTDTNAREGLNSELATLRATMAGNAQRPGVGTLEMFSELRRVRDREGRIAAGNARQEQADFRTEGRNAERKGDQAMLTSWGKAAPSLFDMAQLLRKP